MLDHIILTVSDVERSLAFYEVALKPLNSVTRSTIWCGGEYAGSDPVWNTRLFSFRTE
jgi:catechol 2,3-dioxygenase-like lactoylglutathione lyase family enzyme